MFAKWFKRNWILFKLSEDSHIAMTWDEFKEAMEDAYKAGQRAERKLAK